MTVLEQMGEWVTAAGATALPERVRRRLTTHLLDTVGAWIAGGATEEGQKLASLQSIPSHPISMLGRDPLDRIAVGVAKTRLTEIDDVHMSSCTTPSSVIVPTAIVIAGQMQRRDTRTFAHALFAGYEVMTRFGVAIDGPGILPRGIWPTYLAAPICAAAVASYLLGLTPSQTANALGIALTMTSGAAGKPIGATSRWLLLGTAARAGVAASLAAACGYMGDCTLLDGDWMERAHGIQFNAAPLVAPPQEDGAVDALSCKPYCAAKQTIAAIDAFRSLLAQGVSPQNIVALRAFVPSAYSGMIEARDVAESRLARITSAAYHLALAAYRPAELVNVARPNLAGDPQIASFMDRVEIIADKSLDPVFPRRWPAGVEVMLKNGLRKMELVLDATGDPMRSSELDLRAKFLTLTDPVIGKSAAAELAEACLLATESDEALAQLCARIN
jgi:2-methylcitrate dehydratase PrpD